MRKLHLDPYTGDPVEDRRFHGIPVENHRRLSGGKRKRSRSVLRKEWRDTTRIGTLVLSVNGARFAVVRTVPFRTAPPVSLPFVPVEGLNARNRGHSALAKGYDDAAAPSPASDATDYAPTVGTGEDTNEYNVPKVHAGLAAFRERQRLYKASKRK